MQGPKDLGSIIRNIYFNTRNIKYNNVLDTILREVDSNSVNDKSLENCACVGYMDWSGFSCDITGVVIGQSSKEY